MLEKQTRIAIAASLLWMVVATFVILGTHGPAVAHADSAVDAPAEAPAAEWMALPASDTQVKVTPDVALRC